MRDLLQRVVGRGRALASAVVRRHVTVTIQDGPAKGMRIALRLASSNTYRSGTVELPVQQAVASAMPANGVFFDIGANVGFFTLVAAAASNRTGVYHAFEARPDVAEALSANMSRNKLNTTVWPAAVGDSDGSVTLLMAEHPGGATTEPTKAFDTSGTTVVEQVTIDRLIAEGKLPMPDVVKIDVEGAEPAVLRGMTDTLRKGQVTVVYEIDAPNPEAAAEQYGEVDALLSDLGYQSTRLADSYEGTGWEVIHAVARRVMPS